MHGSIDLRALRILHVDTERGWRGGERQTLWLAQELRRRGHHAPIAARRSDSLAHRASEAGVPVVPCSPGFEADPIAVFVLRRAIRRERIDILHAHSAHGVALGALATVGTRVPLVVARRVDFPLRDNVGSRWKYGRAAAIAAVSEAVARVLERGGIERSRITVVPDATDVHRTIEPASESTLRSLGVSPGRPLVVQVAQLVGHKDPLTFVRAIAAAARKVPTLQALLVGEGPLRPDVERITREAGLGGTLRLTGYRTDADSLLAAATVVCLSSKEEGMGSVLLDALLLGKPVAATRAGGIPEVVENGRSGILSEVGDADALGEAIVRILADKALANRLSVAGRARAAEFSVERMADRTLAVYARVLGLGASAASDDLTDAATRARSGSPTGTP
jgi:glycosyltransferase involved in cell wall biosynthesis